MLYAKNETLTYAELDKLIDKHTDTTQIFFAPPTIQTIIHILSLIRKKIPFCPISPREKTLPSFTLPSSVCTCLATSGTSRTPKFAMHSLENHLMSASYPHPDLELNPGDVWLLSLPLNHIGGLSILLRSYFAKSSIVLADGPVDKVTFLSFVPTQLKRFLRQDNPYPKLRAILVGGAPIPESLCRDAAHLPLYLTYGMTEMTSQVATRRFEAHKGVTFGNPLPHREVKIGEDGEVFVRGKTLFLGYYDQVSPFVDGWFPTRDLGEMGAHGLRILGRKDRMLISGGENIYPEEIEKAFLSLTEVASVHVQKRFDEEFGERPVAMISLSSTCEIPLLCEKLLDFLPKFKIPQPQDIVVVAAPLGYKGSF